MKKIKTNHNNNQLKTWRELDINLQYFSYSYGFNIYTKLVQNESCSDLERKEQEDIF